MKELSFAINVFIILLCDSGCRHKYVRELDCNLDSGSIKVRLANVHTNYSNGHVNYALHGMIEARELKKKVLAKDVRLVNGGDTLDVKITGPVTYVMEVLELREHEKLDVIWISEARLHVNEIHCAQ